MKTTRLAFNIRKFRAWAKSLPEGERFNYIDNWNCPIATFYKSLGHEFVSVSSNTVKFNYRTSLFMPKRLQKVACNLSLIHGKGSGALTKHDIINAAKD